MARRNRVAHTCEQCGRDFTCSGHLTRHMRVHDGTRPYACEEPGCTKTYGRMENLRRHMMSHNPEDKPFQCEKPGCNKTFATKQRLNRHIMLHDRPTPFQCDDCGKEFRKKNQLTLHRPVHTGKLPYLCTEDGCDRAFAMPSFLRKHLASHRQKKYICSEEPCLGSGVAFQKFTELQKHIKMAHRRQHTCGECERVFSTKGSLANHVKTHSVTPVDRLDFKCPVVNCVCAYTKSSNLRAHIRAKHLMQDFVCHICESKFAYKGNLKRHLLTEHGTTLEDEVTTLPTDQPNRLKGDLVAARAPREEGEIGVQDLGSIKRQMDADNRSTTVRKRRRTQSKISQDNCAGRIPGSVGSPQTEVAASSVPKDRQHATEVDWELGGRQQVAVGHGGEDLSCVESAAQDHNGSDMNVAEIRECQNLTVPLDRGGYSSQELLPGPNASDRRYSTFDEEGTPPTAEGSMRLPDQNFVGEKVAAGISDISGCEEMRAVAAAAAAAFNAANEKYDSSGFRAISAL